MTDLLPKKGSGCRESRADFLHWRVLALGGLATLWLAVLADVGTSLLVTANGMRMLGSTRT